MGANIASEIAEGKFSEATVGAANEEHAAVFTKLFHTSTFHVTAVRDVAGAEMCGTLKNIIAIGAGFIDGLGLGNNAKAAIMRVGLLEMVRLSKKAFPDSIQQDTFFESCGIADLITTCFGGRNRKCAEAYVHGGGSRSFDEIEFALLKGQKLQGVLTSNEVQELLENWGCAEEFPLFTTINRICKGEIAPRALVHFAELPTGDDPHFRTWVTSDKNIVDKSLMTD